MKNVIILGSGRSGTSLVTGLVGQSHYKGEQMVAPWKANPKGFFEDKRINNLNEVLLSLYTPNLLELRNLKKGIFNNLKLSNAFKFGQRWLTNIKTDSELNFHVNQQRKRKIKFLLSQQPYCLKDPRFSYTLNAWKPYLENTIFICVFRHPLKTVESIKNFVKYQIHNLGFEANDEYLLDMWSAQYSYILEFLSRSGSWLFLHYDQVVSKSRINELEKFIETKIDTSFIDPSLKRSQASQQLTNRKAIKVYSKLCDLANFHTEEDL